MALAVGTAARPMRQQRANGLGIAHEALRPLLECLPGA